MNTPLRDSGRDQAAWSRSDKLVARKAFDAALTRELQEVIQQTKQMANGIKAPADLWDLEHYLTQRRKEIDRKYDSRTSHFTQVLGKLLQEGRLGEKDLRGLKATRLKSVQSYADFLARMDAS